MFRTNIPTVSELKRIGNKLCIQKKYLRQRKHELLKLIQETSASRIQKWWRNHNCRQINNNDPFTLEPIHGVPFILYETTTTSYGFDLENLIRYFNSEATFINPFTRRQLLAPELRRLDRLASIKFRGPFNLADTHIQDIKEKREYEADLETFTFIQSEYMQHVTDVFNHQFDYNTRAVRSMFYHYIQMMLELNTHETLTFLQTIIDVIDRQQSHDPVLTTLRCLALSIMMQESVVIHTSNYNIIHVRS